jgi:hypothetical protein
MTLGGCAATPDDPSPPAGGAGDRAGASTNMAMPSNGSGGGSVSAVSGAGGSPFFPSVGETAGSAAPGGDAAAPGAEAGSGSSCVAALCDDFEASAPGDMSSSWLIDKDKLGTIVEVTTSKAHGGTHSVHVHVADVAASSAVYGYITETKTFPADQNTFWGRMWLWSEAGSQPSHVVNVEADGTYTGGKTEGVRVLNTMGNKLASNLESTDASQVSSTVLPQSKWNCFEWQVTATELHVYLDGMEITKAAATWPEPNVSKLRIGFQRWANGPAADTWIDDVAVNPTRIGCN